jgi:hypothetical protein
VIAALPVFRLLYPIPPLMFAIELLSHSSAIAGRRLRR